MEIICIEIAYAMNQPLLKNQEIDAIYRVIIIKAQPRNIIKSETIVQNDLKLNLIIREEGEIVVYKKK